MLCMHAYSLQLSDCDPMDLSSPGSPVHGILQEEYWSGLPCPPSGDVLHTGIELASPAFQVDSVPLSHQVIPILLILITKYWLYSSCCTTLPCSLFIHSGLYLLFPIGNHKFVLRICESVSFLLYSLVVSFRFHV